MVNCTKCRQPLGAEAINPVGLVKCPTCGSWLRVDAFPALVPQRTSVNLNDSFVFDDEATCFFHPRKKAFVPCSSCGRFICRLCDVELDGQHLCPTCLDAGHRNHQFKNLENRRVLYDNMALYLAILPVLLVWPSILTAPLSIFVSLRYWKAPTSIIGRRKWRTWLAFSFGLIQIAAWTAVLVVGFS